MAREIFGVIKISSERNDGYTDDSFFVGISTDTNKHIQISTCASPINAMKFLMDFEREKIDFLMDFIRKFYPRKNHKVSFVEVEMNFN